MTLEEIGKHIRRERKKRKMNQGELASLIGMSRTTISQLENGTIRELGIRKVMRVMEMLYLELVSQPEQPRPTLEDLQKENEELWRTGNL